MLNNRETKGRNTNPSGISNDSLVVLHIHAFFASMIVALAAEILISKM